MGITMDYDDYEDYEDDEPWEDDLFKPLDDESLEDDWIYNEEDGCWEYDLNCQAFQLEDGSWYCPAAGTEECEFDCPLGGPGWWERLDEDEGEEDEMPF